MNPVTHTHFMVDLETLSTERNAAIVQIGAAEFEPDGILVADLFQVCVDSPREAAIDFNTVCWWMNQSKDAKEIFESSMYRRPLADALREFALFLARICSMSDTKPMLWAMPASFDVVILEYWYKRFWPNESLPWHYADTRDARTLFELAGIAKADRIKADTPHNALSDAIAQAKTVQMAYKKLGLSKQ